MASYIRTYNSRVHIGNWREDISLEEDSLKDFLERRERGELTFQKLGLLKQNILKQVDLSASTDGWLHFGDTVMLVNPGWERRYNLRDLQKTPQDAAALSINANINGLNPNTPIAAPCDVSGTRTLEPNARTAFVITSVDGSPVGETVRYSQSFALRTTEGFAGGLYLSSEIRTLQKNAKKSRLQEVTLTDEPSFLTQWQVLYFDPQERLEYEGLPVPVNQKVIIAHCKTNQCLAVLGNYILWTSYGKEYEVVAHTCLDSHKAECDANHWLFVTANPGVEAQAIFDRTDPMASITTTENPDKQTLEYNDDGLVKQET
ncbi:hypothetical protein AGOR_G00165770 [Albula goreensis]|uniref:Cilia- and flagella-associated protein 161 n=1 Tax=Albula goreensis TaxID=1534307 RepID=A0A8T3D160_9TELE|nr:hypothetical protein AGOR_G00165770 [Albula goreensis]